MDWLRFEGQTINVINIITILRGQM